MLANPVGRVYAEALFGIAKEQGKVDEVGEEIQGFLGLVRDDQEIAVFLEAPVLEPEEKIRILKKALAGAASDTVTDFLCLLIQKRRIDALTVIAQTYRALADEHAKRTRVEVQTAAPLPGELHTEIESMLREALRREIAIEAETEPALLGGAVVAIGDRVYDGSVRTRLHQFRRTLMRSRGYEDQG
jgi:F-type H+-transporting ATPase subunit delta